MEKEPGSLVEWLLPLAFIVCAGWAIWHIPAYLLDFIPSSDQSLTDQISALQERKDVTPNLPGLFGGVADILDWGALILMPIFFYFGARTVRCTKMEYEHWRPIDRIALFVGRITMMLILIMTGVMLYEVTLRYFFPCTYLVGERTDSLDCRFRVLAIWFLCDATTLLYSHFHYL